MRNLKKIIQLKKNLGDKIMLNNQKGFTLIELMVVVVIIGILAAIALPNFLSMQDRAKESEVKANVHTVQLAVEDFKTQFNGVKPTLFADAGPGVTPTAPAAGVSPGGTALVPATMKNPFANTKGQASITAAAIPVATVTTNPAPGGVTQGQTGYDASTMALPYVIVGIGKNNAAGLCFVVAVTTEGQ